MHEVERDRVTLKTENAMLSEKCHSLRLELDDVKMRQTTQLNEKIHELEMQGRANKEEIKKKDAQILEMNSQAVKVNNEYSK